MAFNPTLQPILRLTESAFNTGLKVPGLGGVLDSAVTAVFPQRLPDKRIREAARENDARLLRSLAHITLAAGLGELPISIEELVPAWEAIKTRPSDVRFDEVVDPHAAQVLEAITPPAPELTSR